MDQKTKKFIILVIVIMAVFGVYMRSVYLKPLPTVAGPEVTHPLEGTYENCDICHRKSVDFHEKTFGYFDNCTRCHGGVANTPHPVEGSYANCLHCHGDIVVSHDAMFPPNVTYENCIGCHRP
ncbi:MAG: hypothetical protein KGZ63_04090 [Clostridiales bacterium]|jgi:hypothetical protein|nr:hypothetical protein [Clostridiales bacterium]